MYLVKLFLENIETELDSHGKANFFAQYTACQ